MPNGTKPLPEPMLTYQWGYLHVPENNFTKSAEEFNPYYELEKFPFWTYCHVSQGPVS